MSLDRIILIMMSFTIFIRLCEDAPHGRDKHLFLCLYKREVYIVIYVLDFVEEPFTGGISSIVVYHGCKQSNFKVMIFKIVKPPSST